MKTLKQYVAEGRPSQRHPLEGHDYHKKSDVELKGIAKDATEAAEAMKGHNTTAENKYRDQANDSATVRHWRRQNGMPEWYKKKYGHIKESVEQIDEMDKTQTPPGRDGGTQFPPGPKVSKKNIASVKKDPVAHLSNLFAKEYAKKKVKEEVDEAYTGKGNNKPGWMLRADPSLAKKIKQKKELVQKRQKAMGDPSAGISVKEEVEQIDEVAAWQRKEGKSESGGLNRKGVESYRRENPGSKLSTAVTTEPSKLKPGSKAANRRKSFCSRMSGMKKKLTSAKTANDPDSRINKSLRKWNC